MKLENVSLGRLGTGLRFFFIAFSHPFAQGMKECNERTASGAATMSNAICILCIVEKQ
jgi:hypothetical protein